MEDFIPAHSQQTQVNELGTLHHNTISRRLDSGEVLIEPRPTLPGNTKVATGDYGRGAFVHRDLPLYVTEDQIATSLASTTITDTEINPNAAASFGILDSGSNRITIVQNAGYDGNYGNIYYGSNEATSDLDLFSYSSKTISTDNETISVATDVDFSEDGLVMYVLGTGDIIYQYTLGSAWDVSTASYASKSIDTTSGLTTGANGICIRNNGTALFVLDQDESIEAFTLSTAYDISTATADGDELDVSVQVDEAPGGGFWMSRDGTKIYVADLTNHNVEEYTLSTPYDLTTGSYASNTLDASTESGDPRGICLTEDGAELYLLDSADNAVYQYDLGTPFDLSTGSYASKSLDLSSEVTSPTGLGIVMNQDGDSLYVVESTAENIYQYDETNSFTKVSDADSPGTPSETIMARGIVPLNGYVYALDTNGNVYNCDNNDITSWTATNVIASERKPDFGCCIVEHKDHICVINTRSIEFFYDASITGASPLQRRQDVYHNVGCVFPNSVSQKGDIVYFFGTDQHGDTDIYILSGFALHPLGNEYIKSLLRDLDTPIYKNPYTSDPELFRQTLVAYTTPDGGTALNMTINGTTYNYSINSGHIAKWYPGEDVSSSTGMFTGNWSTEQILPIVSIYSGTAQGATVYAMLANGYTSEFVYDSDLEDAGGTTAADSFYYMPKWAGGTLMRKKITRIDLIQYPSYDDSLDPSNITLEWVNLDDSGEVGSALTDADFTNGRTFSGLYDGQKIHRCGSTKVRMHKLTFTPAKQQLVEGIKLYYDVVGN